jgi:hypothetical protein
MRISSDRPHLLYPCTHCTLATNPRPRLANEILLFLVNMELPTTPPPRKPAVLRTYGKKREAPLFPILSPPSLTRSDSLRSSDDSSAIPSSDSGVGIFEDDIKIRGISPVSEDMVKEEVVGEGLRWVKKKVTTTPVRSPFSPSTSSSQPGASGSSLRKVERKGQISKASTPVQTPGQSTLRAFFTPKPRPEPLFSTGLSLRAEVQASVSSSVKDATLASPVPLNSKPGPGTSSSSKPTDPIKKLRQLHFKRPSSSSSSSSSSFTTCKKCNMSYIRGEPDSEDETLHRKNCERVVDGQIWDERERDRVGGKSSVGKQVGGEVGFEKKGRQGAGGIRTYKGVGRILQIEGALAAGNPKVRRARTGLL